MLVPPTEREALDASETGLSTIARLAQLLPFSKV